MTIGILALMLGTGFILSALVAYLLVEAPRAVRARGSVIDLCAPSGPDDTPLGS